MPTNLLNTTFTVDFQLGSTPKQINVTDTSDYAGYGVNLSDVQGVITVYDPSGNAWYVNQNGFSAPDIDGSVPGGLTNLYTIALPTLPDGSVTPGTYKVVMVTQITGNTPFSITTVNTYNYTFVAPTISITQTVDCITPRFTSSDTTNYVVNGITPTIVRSHKVYYASQPINNTAPANTPTVILNSGQFYQGLQQTVLTSTLVYDFGNGQTVSVVVTGTKTISVDCTYFCAIYCCLRSLNSNIKKYKGVNDMLASQYEAIFAQVMGLVELATLAYSCGKANDVSGYVTQIQALADCTDDCGCQDGAASPVFGLGGAGSGVNVTITSCPGQPNGITVTQSGVSPNINYELCLDPATYAKIQAQYNTVVAAGTGISVSSATLGSTTTYTVSSTYTPESRVSFQCEIIYTGATCTVNIINSQVSGSLLQTPTTAYNVNVVPLNPVYPWTNNKFSIEGFFDINVAPATNNFKVLATAVNPTPPKALPSSLITTVIKSKSSASDGTVEFTLVDEIWSSNPTDYYFQIRPCTIIVNFEIITY